MIYKLLTDLIAFPKRIKRHLTPQPHKGSFSLSNETSRICKIITHPVKHLNVKDQRNRIYQQYSHYSAIDFYVSICLLPISSKGLKIILLTDTGFLTLATADIGNLQLAVFTGADHLRNSQINSRNSRVKMFTHFQKGKQTVTFPLTSELIKASGSMGLLHLQNCSTSSFKTIPLPAGFTGALEKMLLSLLAWPSYRLYEDFTIDQEDEWKCPIPSLWSFSKKASWLLLSCHALGIQIMPYKAFRCQQFTQKTRFTFCW